MVELRWEGKYDKDGKRVAPLKVALPFQTVETVNESAQQRQRSLEFMLAGRDAEWRNRLIWGDKKYVLPSLLPEFAGKVDLIYIDPPFATGQDFSFQATVGDERFTKEPSIIEQKAYRDTWAATTGIAKYRKYLPWFYETVVFLYELLSESGSLYVHVDPNVSHYVKLILDEVFGIDNFRNEITWKRTNTHNDAKRYGKVHEHIFYYPKSVAPVWNTLYIEHDEDYVRKSYRYQDEDGRRWTSSDLTATSKKGGGYDYTWNGVRRLWLCPIETMEKMHDENRLYYTRNGLARRKHYLDESKGKLLNDFWDDINPISSQAHERLNYPTQKPEALLDRIIRASSNEGDLVLDCFCGSGTTPAVAEKLNRRWIACDLGRFAIHTSRKRLLGIENVRPFVVQNLGKYERQVWQKAEFGDEAALQTRAYRKFILDLYHAELVDGYAWLHGRKGGRMVHVGSVDSPVAVGDVRNIALEFRRAIGTGADAPTSAGVDVLGWDFALDMNETAGQIAQEAGLQVRFLRIPREVLEQKAVDQGDIQFFELAALSVAHQCARRELSIELTDFMIPPDDVPDDVAKAVRHWSDWIDYWAVDWNYRDDTFHNEWQSYRTRKDRTLLLRANHRYAEPGDYVVLVKVIDILGNDSTKTLNVTVV